MNEAAQNAHNVFAAGWLAGILMKDGRATDIDCVGYRAPEATNVLTFKVPDYIRGKVRVTVEVEDEED